MYSLIVIDYYSIKKTAKYLSDIIGFIKERDQLNIILVDNSEQGKENLQYICKFFDTEFQLYPYSVDEVYQVKKGVICNIPTIYVMSKENLGYARGNNLGAKIANIVFGDSYYIFSNNDMRFEQKISLQKLADVFKSDEHIATVGPKIVGLDGKPQSPRKKQGIWGMLFKPYLGMLFSVYRSTDLDYTGKSKVCYWVSGSFLMVDSHKFQKINGFDGNTFLYGEEMILAERLIKHGYYMYFLEDIVIVHEHAQTVNSTLGVLKGIELSFQSALYYMQEYRGINNLIKAVAICNYKIFKILFRIKKIVIGRLRK